jgi:glycosyltransferase involved in cell wall biosynthesis
MSERRQGRAQDRGSPGEALAKQAAELTDAYVKVALGSRPYDGPWGGGNRFIAALAEQLSAAGHHVVHDLDDSDIDIILLTDPRVRAPNVCFGAGAIFRHLALRNPRAIVIHRINECDERKGERFINHKLVRANYVADVTVFVGEWLVQLPVWRKHLRSPWFVVRNGADTRLFNRAQFQPWEGIGPLRLVTHHWGYHPMKGFDIYAKIDRMLGEPRWNERLSFTYIGNLPNGFSFANARYVAPLDGEALATELASHHAYVTASINEPGGNHQNEGALCGLPLLYRKSGCMPEYCAGFGVEFSGPDNFEAAVDNLIDNYAALAVRMPSYPHTAVSMTREWTALFEELLLKRDEIVSHRALWRHPLTALVNQLPL